MVMPVTPITANAVFTMSALRGLRITVPLASRIVSAAGRVDYLRVKLTDGTVVPIAAGGASNLSSTVEADGFVLVDHPREFLEAGERVEVWLYDS